VSDQEVVNNKMQEVVNNKMTVNHLYHRQTPLTSITLSKGQKGTYAYDIKVEGEDDKKLIEQLKQIDSQLRKEFAVGQKEGDNNA
jgi:hypothetical protein